MTNPDEIRVDTTTEYKSLGEILAALGADNAELASLEDDYASNAPCDFSGYCAGASCPYFMQCKGD